MKRTKNIILQNYNTLYYSLHVASLLQILVDEMQNNNTTYNIEHDVLFYYNYIMRIFSSVPKS